MLRKCTKCYEIKEIDQFPKMVKHLTTENPIWRAHCRKCDNALVRKRNAIRKIVGKAPEDHICPICGRNKEILAEQTRFESKWTIDHNHDTNEFRDWLCHPCNRALGIFGDDIKTIEKALAYLIKHSNK